MAKSEKGRSAKNEVVEAVAAHLLVDHVKHQITKPIGMAVVGAAGAGGAASLAGVAAVGLGLTLGSPVIAVVAVIGGIIGLAAAASK